MSKSRNLGNLADILIVDGSNNVAIPNGLTATGLISAGILKADSVGKLVPATLGTDYISSNQNITVSATGEATGTSTSSPTSPSIALTLSTSAVTGKVLSGLNLTGGGTIASTDSILQAFGKVQNQISAMIGGVIFQSVWNASTNSPALATGVGTKGYYYIVSVAGSTNLNGITDWKVGDWAIFNGTGWDKVDNTDAVSSVNGYTGAVSLTTSDVAEGTNLYHTDARSRASISSTATGITYNSTTGVLSLTSGYGIPTTASQANWDTAYTNRITSLTTTGSSGSATLVSNTLNIPTYTLAGLGGQPQLNGTGFVKASGTTISYDNSTYLTGNQTITLSGDVSGSGATAITTTIGALKVTNAMLAGSIDYAKMNSATVPTWNQNTTGTAANITATSNATLTTLSVLSLPYSQLTGVPSIPTVSGTANYIPKFTASSTIGNSIIQDDGTNVSVGYTTNPSLYKLDVNGTGRFTGTLLTANASSSTYLNLQNTTGTIGGGEAIAFVMDYTSTSNTTGWKILSRYAGGNLQFVPNYHNGGYNTAALSLNYDGAATFSSSVTATGGFFQGNGSFTNNAFWGTLLTAGTGSYSDFAIIDNTSTQIMRVPTGTRNVVFSSSVTAGGSPTSLSSPTLLIAAKNGTVANIGGFQIYTTSTSNDGNNNGISSGSYYNGTSTIATTTSSSIYQQYLGSHYFYSNTGLTATSAFTPTAVLSIASSGAATFSSSVQASNIGINYAPQSNIRAVIQGSDSTSSNYGLVVYDNTPVSNFWVRNDGAIYARGAATFSSSVTATNLLAQIVAGADTVGGNIILSRNDTTNYRGGAIFSYYYSANAAGNQDTLSFGVSADTTSPATVGKVKMVLTEGGHLGIGITSPNVSGQGSGVKVLTVQGSTSYGVVEVSTNQNTSDGVLLGAYGFANSLMTTNYKLPAYIGSWLEGGGVTSGANIRFHTQPSGTAGAVERMRITSAGVVQIANLAGTGSRIVGTDASGNLSSITIGSGLSLSAGVLTATGGTAGTVTGSGASSQIGFWTSASNMSGSSNFVWDNTNSRLGIGVTPTTTLDVNGTGKFTGDLTIKNTTTHANLFLDANASSGSEAGLYFKIGGTNKYEVYTANNDSALNFYSYGNTSIILKLASTGAATFSGDIGWGGVTPTGNAGVSNTIESSQGAQIAARQSFPQLYLSSNVSGTPYSPTRKVAGYAAQLSLDAFGGTISLNRAVTSTAGSAITWISNLGFDNAGAATFSSTVSATQLTALAVDAGTAIFAKRTGGVNTFALNVNADSSWTMYDYATGSYTAGITQKSGNIGIGTASPVGDGTALNIYGTSYATLKMQNSTTGSLITDGSEIVVDGSNWIFKNREAGDNIFYTSNTERMRITSGGLVGIGTTSPSTSILHLNYNSVNNRALRLQDENGIFDIITSGASSSHSLGVYDETNSAYRLFITSGGNVLVGTTTDNGDKLYVGGNMSSSGRMYAYGGSISAVGTASTAIGTGPYTAIVNSSNSYQILQQLNASYGLDYWAYSGGWSKIATLSATGDLNISGTTASTSGTTGALVVGGGIGAGGAIYASSFFETSDKNIKTLIEDNYQATGISNVTPKLYVKNGIKEVGYFAQDFEGIMPSAVSKSSDGLLSLSYREVHTAKIYALEQRIKELEAKLNN